MSGVRVNIRIVYTVDKSISDQNPITRNLLNIKSKATIISITGRIQVKLPAYGKSCGVKPISNLVAAG